MTAVVQAGQFIADGMVMQFGEEVSLRITGIQKLQHRLTDAQLIPIRQAATLNRLIVDETAIGRAQVLNPEAAFSGNDPAVFARDAALIDAEITAVAATDDQLLT